MNYIYKIENDINGKIYIGQTTKTIEQRFEQHIKDSRDPNDNKPLHCAIRKYGKEHFHLSLLEEVDESQSLDEREQYYIELYNSYGQPNGYNATKGGNLFSKDINPTNLPEIRKKISDKQKVNSYWKTEEWKQHQRERWSGDENPSKSAEGRAKISKRVSGQNNPACREDVKEKIRQSAIGRHPSDEARKKMSENNARFWKGKHIPQHVTDAMAKARTEKCSGENNYKSQPFFLVDPNTGEKVYRFSTVREAQLFIFNDNTLLSLIPAPTKGSNIGVVTISTVGNQIRKAKERGTLICGYKLVYAEKCND